LIHVMYDLSHYVLAIYVNNNYLLQAIANLPTGIP